jgi:integrase
MTGSQRLEEVIKKVSFGKVSKFAESIGYTRQAIYPYLSGKKEISATLVDRILTIYPEVDGNWLRYGYLQEIATIKGITKKLTSHVGRHTFATVMLEKGLPLETISHILGHASTDTTRVYARILMSKINKDLDRLNILGI